MNLTSEYFQSIPTKAVGTQRIPLGYAPRLTTVSYTAVQHVDLPTKERAAAVLASLPYGDRGNLWYFGPSDMGPEAISEICLDDIVGSTCSTDAGGSWNFIDPSGLVPTRSDRIYDFAKLFHQGSALFNEPSQLPAVFGFGNLYCLTDHNHRTAGLKCFGIRGLQIPARVATAQGKVASLHRDSHIFLKRGKSGLWAGTVDKALDRVSLSWVEGPWVFAKDMDAAKAFYLNLRPDLYSSNAEADPQRIWCLSALVRTIAKKFTK